MGTQQILMIVLSVIIVGIAVGVGITMFQTQAENSNRQAIISDLTNFKAQSIAYFKTPAIMGGGGNGNPGFDSDNYQAYLGLEAGATEFSNDNGTYKLVAGQHDVTITGTGTERGGDGTNPVSAYIKLVYSGTPPLLTTDSLYVTN